MEGNPSPRGSAAARLFRTVLRDTAKIGALFAVVIGATLWVMAPTCACTTEEYRYTQMMKGDLRSLWSAQEIYYSDHEAYSASPSELLRLDYYADGFQPSSGVRLTVDDATADGFSAHATHAGTPVRCVFFVGDVRSPDPTSQPGEIYCSDS
jgi:hypothetical protein